MKVPLSWLRDYIEVDLSAEKIAEILTLAGLEVDKIEIISPSFENVVVAKVIDVKPHPNAERLRIATVFDGVENLQVVCAASNCREGIKTALARIDASLKDEEGKVFKIKKGKLREVESFGMLCAADELGLPGDATGIMEFDQELAEGTDLKPLYSDTIFEISLTPNLGHCMSILGVARELAAQLNIPCKKPSIALKEDPSLPIQEQITISVLDKKAVPRYTCRVLKGVEVKTSPTWIKNRLELCGIRSVNNCVDISNYVLLELGQPLHIFDYDTIKEKTLFVGANPAHSSFLALDDASYSLPPDALLISDPKEPLAVAGVIGSKSSCVTENTKNILIESAFFTKESVRKCAKKMGLRTDASNRFEKTVDPEGVLVALNHAAELIQRTSPCSIAAGVIDIKEHSFAPLSLTLRQSRVNQMLGIALSLNEIRTCLERLEMQVRETSDNCLTVLVPTYRNDITSEIDLIEEVARIYGYNNIPKNPPRYVSSLLPSSPLYLFEKAVRAQCRGEGLTELLTCDLISEELAALCLERGFTSENLIRVLQPSSVDQSVLRASLLPGLLQVAKYNIDHQNAHISGFEVGKVHFKEGKEFKEHATLGILMTGATTPYHFDSKPKEGDFFTLKGYLENILQECGSSNIHFEASHFVHLHPGRQAKVLIDNCILGVLGEVHPSCLKIFGIEQRVFFAEIHLNQLFLTRKISGQVKELPTFPASERDWTFTLSEATPLNNVINVIEKEKSPLLEKILLLDLYKSEQIGKDRRNITLRFIYRQQDKTISFETVEKEHAMIIHKVKEKIPNI